MKLTKKQISIVDEFDRPVTSITSITVQDVGTSDSKSIYKDKEGQTAITNPITTSSTNTTLVQDAGLFYFWSHLPTFKLVVTDGTASRTIDNLDSTISRIRFASDLGDG